MPQRTIDDFVNIPMTGHFIGGCPMGDRPTPVWSILANGSKGDPGLHVIDAFGRRASRRRTRSRALAAGADLSGIGGVGGALGGYAVGR